MADLDDVVFTGVVVSGPVMIVYALEIMCWLTL